MRVIPLWRLLLPLVLPAALRAQRVSLGVDAGAAAMRYADTISTSGASLSPSLSAEWSRASLSASGTYSRFGTGSSIQGIGGGSMFTPSAGWLVGEVAGSIGGSRHQDGARTGQAMGTVRAHLMTTNVGGWAGAGVGRARDAFFTRSFRESEAGVWSVLGLTTLLATASPTVVNDSIRFTDVQAAARYVGNDFELGAVAGRRVHVRDALTDATSQSWLNASATWWATANVGLVAGGGTYPVDLTQGFPGGRFATLSVRLSMGHESERARARTASSPYQPTPVPFGEAEARTSSNAGAGTALASAVRSFNVEVTNGARVVVVEAPTARSVEVTGDFTGWKPMALVSSATGTWRLPVRLARGTYQVMVRTNGGAWQVPPGLLAVNDEFGGKAGLILIE